LLFLFLGQNEKKGPKKLQEFDLDLHEQTSLFKLRHSLTASQTAVLPL